MLQGARRLPEQERVPPRATCLVVAHRSSFFSRPFSSYVHRTTSLVGRWIYQQRRFAPLSGRAASAFVTVVGRYRVKPRIEARGRAHFAFSPFGTMVGGSLDPRFLRYKSPRSRQYLLRLSAAAADKSSDERRAELEEHRGVSYGSSESAAGRWTRLSRRMIWRGYGSSNGSGSFGAALARVRGEMPMRRSPTYLAARQRLARMRRVQETYNTFCSRRKSTRSPWATRLMRSRLRSFRHYFTCGHLTRQQAVQRLRHDVDFYSGIKYDRSVLHYRAPSRRVTKVEYRAEQVIPPAPFALREKLANSARRWGRFFVRDLLSIRRECSVRTHAY